ncbi:exopolyphosphatase [Pelomicrobium methylotrophicum]|uniref:Exopolyphosphatase n=1 Tax=Pelomicrobium methylotrophicum TaxID=2602750 RepID=A0A5C7EPR6_9PROT|nr:exopolyphosphatase [Pelomicrobium methylotrophicum]TXF13416.1 exopolyphosphatase [Pelomicrobium methylotrophicum]
MGEYSTLAAVDLGSNSFRLQVARVVGDQLYPLDSLREPVRLAAGLTHDKRLDEETQARALACLRRFGERLRGLPPHAVRAVGTNTLRVAKNASQFLKAAEQALGFPIEVVAGREEARLIYLGVAHALPASEDKRLVIDIGGGSTEFIIGRRRQALKLESLYMGCVSWSLRFFPDGKITKGALKEAELAARTELMSIAGEFCAGHWQTAYGSSGTIRAIGDLLAGHGGNAEITPEGLDWLRSALLKAGDTRKLDLPALRPDRAPVLPGGFAILSAAVSELGIERLRPATGALREGVLYDLLGRFHHQDMRDVTVNQFMQRYHVDASQARRVAKLAVALASELLAGAACDREAEIKLVEWAAKLHEVGISVAHSGYHKHSAYILRYADMPGFSKREQERLSCLVLGHRGSLKKMQALLASEVDLAETLALRLAALVHRSRRPLELPPIHVRRVKGGFQVALSGNWLAQNPLTAHALEDESQQWRQLGLNFEVQWQEEAILHAAS